MPRRAAGLALGIVVAVLAWHARPGGAAEPRRATWLWNPAPMLADASARAALFDFLGRERVSVVWAQVDAGGPQLASAAQWRTLIAEATSRHVSIEALDGAPSYAIQEDIPRHVVDTLLAYNQSVPAGQRFSGIHLDIEPYLLWAWRSPQRRQDLLRRYLDLLQWCRRRIDGRQPGLALGADIPFWWQAADARTGRAIGDVAFNGVTKAASYHVIDLLDNVGIMAYRNRAAGANGMIALGEDLLAYADKAGRAALWMGVETSRDAPSPVWFAVGLPADAIGAALDGDAAIAPDRTYGGFRLSVFDDGASLHVGLGLRGMDPAHPTPALVRALADLARTYGVLSRPGTGDRADQARARAIRALSADAEWQTPVARAIVDPRDGREYPGVMASSIMPPVLTFEGAPPGLFRLETAAAESSFSSHPSYRGLAIHHYDSYRRLVDGPPRLAIRPADPGWRSPRY